ncbi:MAG: 50S ribosomal protein L18 [Bacteroidetes Order II. Incertae sedis bacterium]|nr:50S ribosomal protein L18 [Bacteroidetes Order II. bacterium]
MAIKKTKNKKVTRRQRIRRSIRSKISGTASRPRLAVFRSNAHIYAQLIDDHTGQTLVAASTVQDKGITGTGSEQAKSVGLTLAGKAKESGIETCVFDRAGFPYHGRVKALAEGAREGGLNF